VSQEHTSIQFKPGDIDIPSNHAHITIERMDAFQFANAHKADRYVAVYAQHMNHQKFVHLDGIAAGVSLDAYLLTIFTCCSLHILFAFIEYARPSNAFSSFNVASAILPCFNCQVHYTSNWKPIISILREEVMRLMKKAMNVIHSLVHGRTVTRLLDSEYSNRHPHWNIRIRWHGVWRLLPRVFLCFCAQHTIKQCC